MNFSLYLCWTEQLHYSWPSKFTFDVEFWKQVPPSEPYRVIIGDVRDKLYHTRERTRQLLSNGFSEIPEEATYTNIKQVCNTSLLLVFFITEKSLRASGPVANGFLWMMGSLHYSYEIFRYFVIFLVLCFPCLVCKCEASKIKQHCYSLFNLTCYSW